MIDIEYIIRGDPDACFGLHASLWPEALQPSGFVPQQRPGFGVEHLDIEIENIMVTFSPEPPGWLVTFSDPVDTVWAAQVVQAICTHMERVSGQGGEITLLPPDQVIAY